MLRGRVRPVAVDLHDHPVLQAEALHVALEPGRRERLDELFEANVAAFERLIVPSRSFSDLCGLPADRVVVVTNGTDSGRIVPAPLPAEPTVALVSGAAPGRGIELLLEAMEQVRQAVPEAVLRLALSSTGPASASYRADLAARLGQRRWVNLEDVPYAGLGAFLAGAWVMVVPHPPGEYYDASTPVKLFDALASGRPVVVTPRLETRRIIEEADAGVVASDDADGLAEAIAGLLGDPDRSATLGANGRQAAEERYDWSVLGEQLADALLADLA
jgi:glycosyltransferase involved in cell wall biosynthesis